MTRKISEEHKQALLAIKKSLTEIGPKEGNFIKVELLFYNAMGIARQYGDDENENKLLAALKNLQANQYQNTKMHFKKSSQREIVIRRFMNEFKTVLSAGIKNLFFTVQLSN